MKLKIKKPLLVLVLVLFFVGIGYYFLFSNEDKAGNTAADNIFGWKYPVTKFPKVGPDLSNQIAYSDIRDPGGVPQGLPVRLKIPVIEVDSAIEDALITPDGRMDVPSGSVNVAWFALGPHPGRVGSAVIGGHFGIKNGRKFVFYDLDKLKVGDKVYITDDRGDTLSFKVRLIKLFDRNADATTVFTSDDGLAHLNLITCEGIWNQINSIYPERRVIFTDVIPEENASQSTEVGTIIAIRRSLNIGMQGADVIALQTILQQKQFLVLPPAVDKGYFGELTAVAVARYQKSVDLPSVGVFGPLTRARLISELGSIPGLPSTAIDGNVKTSKILESFYSTPMDDLITLFLLVSISFVTFKIIRR